jgi:Immunity protein 50
MTNPATFVEQGDHLTALFGGWPSFHDGEVHTMDLWRGDVCPARNSWIGAVLTAKIQVLEAAQRGASHAGNDTLVTLRFHDIDRLELRGFNHQNAIIGLWFERESRGDGLPDYICVEFQQAHGVQATFVCFRVEFLSAEPYSDATQNA